MSLPNGWKKGRLGEECSIEIGGTPSRNIPDYWDDTKETTNLWVSIRDLNQREINRTAEQVTAAGVKHSNVKRQPTGTVLLSFKLTIGRVAVAGLPLYTNEAIAGLRSENIDRDYLYHGLQQWDLLKGVDQAIKGATLNKEKLKRIEFHFPESKTEQAKIADVLSTMDCAIEQTEALLAKQRRIMAGLMQDLLTRGIDEQGKLRSEQTHKFKDSPLGRIPVEWETLPLSGVANLQVGYAFKSSWFSEDGVRLLRGENVGVGQPDWKDTQSLSVEIAKDFQSYYLEPGDLIIGMDRTFTKQGFKVSLLTENDTPALLVQRVGRFIPSTITKSFMRLLIQAPSYQRELLLQQKGMDIPHLSRDEILKPLVPVPCESSEMNGISKCVESMENFESKQRENLVKLKFLKTALMQDLLTGRKRVTVLLESRPKREKVYAGY